MAGAGSRFQAAGYTLPKPFIDVNGKMMIERVLDGLQVDDAIYTLIIQEQFKQENSIQLDILKKNYGVQFVAVEKLTQGASCTALAAYEIINDNNIVVFADSDNFIDNKVFVSFIDDVYSRKLDGSLLTFNTDNPCFSYVKVDAYGYAVCTREKEVISNNAITGVYLFARGKNFVKCAMEMMIYGDRTKNEYYMSNVYNYAIRKGLKIGCYNIHEGDLHCVGTPSQLNSYLDKVK